MASNVLRRCDELSTSPSEITLLGVVSMTLEAEAEVVGVAGCDVDSGGVTGVTLQRTVREPKLFSVSCTSLVRNTLLSIFVTS